jgi:predicted NACHT family NTPase
MSELSSGEQRQLADKWLSDTAQVDLFFKELDRSPALRKLMGVPLLGTLILNLYRRAPTIPENKASLYRTFVDLYCGGWDTAKGVRNPGTFRTEQKLRPLSNLAYRMHLNNQMDCTESMFRQAVDQTMPSLLDTSSELLSETIQDGILVRSGSQLLFAHLSFQEYLAAQFLASDPRGERPKQALRHYLRGGEWWKDVIEFYIISRDDPAALDDWIRRVAIEVQRQGSGKLSSTSQNPREDLRHRLQILAGIILETFPGYRIGFVSNQSLSG